LVVDASVVHAAGETAHPVSSSCRDCLETIRHVCHRVAVTARMRDEWNRHMSRFSRKWLRSMAARRKPLQSIAGIGVDIRLDGLSTKEREAILKDRCLLEAAAASDHVIVTLDDALRQALAKTRQGARLAASIRWVNPVHDGVGVLKTL